jgi:hypothetical protein
MREQERQIETMKAKGIFGAYVATAPASGADNADAASNEQAIQHQPILHYGVDEQECWLARWCAAPGVWISWRKGH